MKILFFVGEFPKLSQTFILNQITGLIDAGHEVTILAKKSGGAKVHPDVLYYDLLDHVVYYGDSAQSNSRIRKGCAFVRAFCAHGISRVFNKNVQGQAPLRELLAMPNLVLLIRKLNQVDLTDYSVIMAHFGPNGLLAQKCIEMGLLRGKLFTAFHGYDMLRFVKQKGSAAYNDLFRSPSVILPISEHWRRRCIALGAEPSKTVVHHMGIDLLRFDCHPSQPAVQLFFVSAARLVEKKGLQYAIEAVAQLVKRGYSVRYAIAGDGPLKDKLQEQIERCKMTRHIQLVGWKTQDEWIKLMKDAQVVLAPSVTASDGDMEGIPVQLMEAMAMEKLVVATIHSGIPELIQDGENGYLVPERDAASLAQALEKAIKTPEKWKRITQNARRTIKESFNIQKLNTGLLQLFKNSLDEPRRNPK
ncbi:glycosyltransferase [Sporolactobacillus terrae]|uniref:Colanic acid biosynthesis glycosyltransferase WcaL n=1 Tax=Sporolactobacillus terrae TaxID=269673 RepID=A0A5K7WWG6_9BACL|nr:glycosyltransferase [Sporolactobacillus terrae]BBN98004.1 colanic acid biosynthesis glycosyltransferase WcaL [Sporolactobacillus terrae]